MAPSRSFALAFLSLVLQCPSFAVAAPWIATKLYEASEHTYRYAYETTTETTIQEITPTAAPMPAALSTATFVTSPRYGDAVTVVQVLYPSGAGAAATYDRYGYYDTGHVTTDYYVNMVYSASGSCSTQSPFTTALPVDVPGYLRGAVPATSTTTTYSVDSSRPFQPTTYTNALAFIDPTQLPASSLSSLSDLYMPYTMRYGCYDSNYGSGSSRYGGSSDYSDRYYHDFWFDYPYAIVIIPVVAWFVLWLIIGLIENWFQFRRLMKGWQARRGFPISWCMVAPIISCLLLCFSCKGFQARSVDEAQVLKEKWNQMGFWKKIGLWLRWGFGFSYPSILGSPPDKVGRPSKRPVAATAPLLSVSPPRSVAGDDRSDLESTHQNSTVSGPEMAQAQADGQMLQVPISSTRQAQQQDLSTQQEAPDVPVATGALPSVNDPRTAESSDQSRNR
ncbi:uncharacterized protein ACLA_060700 [Aspergillus clavatus NRRL 1]|uniref:Uncharacterized protein n=1 Tax=Aspergillus clavatus (strain ATCC 1007 / CBS 513.65 / DSM 816 / NCTC 3887 / NRRL 1 / QM 1276 / 107) TaxID=344612 RepID=A1CC58_ASPCL|nr:uncharacterized protein ACLA_060700 [Aspergillus clavatus NRRL 1]EAW12115.1 conserved hypothetical protein [Aspergillus clavatus NRRL 1]